jgi:hypothetical protein
VLDEVRGAHVVEGTGPQGQHGAVAAHRAQVDVGVQPHRRGGRLLVVVDAHEHPVVRGEPDGAVAQSAAEVEHAAAADPGTHLAVPGRVQGQE